MRNPLGIGSVHIIAERTLTSPIRAAASRATVTRLRVRDRVGLMLLLVAGAFAIGLAAGANPAAVIGGAAGAAFVTIVLADVTLGLMCFGLIAFFEVLPGLSGTVSAEKVAGTLVALSWLATIAFRPRLRRGFFSSHPVASFTAVVFIAWLVLSLTWAENTSAGVTAISRYALNLLLLPIAYTAIRTRRHAFWLVGVLVAGASLSALYGMLFARGNALAEGTTRLAGAGIDANYLASLLVSGIVLATVLASVRTVAPAVRVLALASLVLCMVGLIDTVSRGGMLGLGAAMLAGIAFAGPGRRLRLGTVALVIALSVVGFYATVASPAARQRIVSVQGGSGRDDIWTVGWRMVEANPVQGVGVGNFPNRTIDYLLRPGIVTRSVFIVDDPKVAHNIYLEILAETGIVGLALFMGLIAFLLSCGIRAAWAFRRLGDGSMEVLSRGVVVAVIGILVTDFFISDQFSKPLWIQLSLLPALLAIASRHASVAARSA